MKKIFKKVTSGVAVLAACLTFLFAFYGCKKGLDNVTQWRDPVQGSEIDTITYTAVATNSGSNAKINFNFSAAVSELKASDITIDVTPPGAATMGTLTGSARKWSLAVNVTADGVAAVSIKKSGIENGTKGITLSTGSPSGITYTAVADGDPTRASTKIDFEFSADVSALTADEIIIDAMSGMVNKKDVPTKTGAKRWTIPITVTTGGAAGVTINKAGIDKFKRGITLYTVAPVVSPSSIAFVSAGGDFDIAITASDAWTASSDTADVTLDKTFGLRDDKITVTVGANSGAVERVAIVTVSFGPTITETITITQDAAGT